MFQRQADPSWTMLSFGHRRRKEYKLLQMALFPPDSSSLLRLHSCSVLNPIAKRQRLPIQRFITLLSELGQIFCKSRKSNGSGHVTWDSDSFQTLRINKDVKGENLLHTHASCGDGVTTGQQPYEKQTTQNAFPSTLSALHDKVPSSNYAWKQRK